MKKILLLSILLIILLAGCNFSYETKMSTNSSISKSKAPDGTCTVKITKNDNSWECVEPCDDIDIFAQACQQKEQ